MLVLLSGTANRRLAQAVAARLGLSPGGTTLERLPDGELRVLVDEPVRGASVYLLQPTSPPPAEHLLELILLADACRRSGARRVTGVIPYLAYARQDRVARGGEALAARVIADVLSTRLDRCLLVELHAPAAEACFRVPVEQLSAAPVLLDALARTTLAPDVVVAAAPGAMKLAQHYARSLSLPLAIVHTERLDGGAIASRGLMGDMRGRTALVVDDMISTGATMEAAVQAVVDQGRAAHVVVLATHAVLAPGAARRLDSLPVERFLVTDTVESHESLNFDRLEIVSVAGLLADGIRAFEQEMGP